MDSLLLVLQDSSFLFMGRLLEGFGVGIISYVVTLKLLGFIFYLVSFNGGEEMTTIVGINYV